MSIENDYRFSSASGLPADLLSCSPEELTRWLHKQGEASYRANQILKWLYSRNCHDFSQMTDLPLFAVEDLEEDDAEFKFVRCPLFYPFL